MKYDYSENFIAVKNNINHDIGKLFNENSSVTFSYRILFPVYGNKDICKDSNESKYLIGIERITNEYNNLLKDYNWYLLNIDLSKLNDNEYLIQIVNKYKKECSKNEDTEMSKRIYQIIEEKNYNFEESYIDIIIERFSEFEKFINNSKLKEAITTLINYEKEKIDNKLIENISTLKD